jgi:hypothetical protein
MMDVWSLIDQLAPLNIVLEEVRNSCILSFPSVESQNQIALFLRNKEEKYPLPPKYLLALLKALEKDIANQCMDSSEDQFSDEFLELYLEVRNKVGDEEDTGYQQFQVLGNSHSLPILIKRSHNQVGTKVWSAGLLIAEILQYAFNDSVDNVMLSDKSFIELGAGVGISSLLWYCSLCNTNRMKDLLITDYAWSVMELVDKNIEVARSIFFPTSTETSLRSSLLDWANLSNDDVEQLGDTNCLFAADCTYSPDLNIVLVRLFQIYFPTYLHRHPEIQCELNNFQGDNLAINKKNFFGHLLKCGVPCVLIACTVRNEETFSHFVKSLEDSAQYLSYQNISVEIREFLNGKELYYIPDRHNVEVFCIFPTLATTSLKLDVPYTL